LVKDDLKHTFGRRLKAAGATEEDRKSFLRHKTATTLVQSWQLIEAANKASATDSRGPVLTNKKRRQA